MAIAEKLNLPGFGKDGFAPGWNLTRLDDWYLKLAANLAVGDKDGDAVVEARITGFCDALPYPGGEGREARSLLRKQRSAAQDFAAELLHFAEPQAHPLMTRWVWDASTGSGALREMINGDFKGRVDHGAARGWLYERFAEQSIWREQHWLADLVLAMAYVGYFRAMTGGVLGSDFTRSSGPDEQLRKLLGVDGGARSRVKKSPATIH